MSLLRPIAAALAFACATVTQSASATVYTVTFNGSFSFGQFQASADSPTIPLTGMPFQVVWTIDDSKGHFVSNTPTDVDLRGGTDRGYPSPVSAVVAIPGIAIMPISGETDALVWRHDVPAGVQGDYVNYSAAKIFFEQPPDVEGDYTLHDHFEGATFYIGDDTGHIPEQNPANWGNLIDSAHIGAPLARPIAESDYLYVGISYIDSLYDSATDTSEYLYLLDGSANQGELTFAETAAVPEPASWAMMIGGFALVGGAMRRRSRRLSFRPNETKKTRSS